MNKNRTTVILIIIIIAAIIATIMIKKNQTKEIITEQPSASDIQINQAIESDSTVSINQALNNIKVDDTSDKDLIQIDTELKNL